MTFDLSGDILHYSREVVAEALRTQLHGLMHEAITQKRLALEGLNIHFTSRDIKIEIDRLDAA